jgi:localization factor PodJL
MPSTALLLPVPPAYPLASAAPKNSAPAEKEPAAKEPGFTGSVRPPAATPSRSPEPAKHPPIPPAYAAALDALPPSLGSDGLRAALARGDATAQYELGVRFAEGRGIPQDFKGAAEWFERAAKQGLAPAQFRLAVLQEKGTGVPKDLQSARRLYLAAGQAGNGKALHNLAVLYAEGIDGKPDYATAAKWFRKAADYGITDSQYNLGILYAGGIGIQANLAEAYRWLELAARSGDKESAAKRDEIGTRLDPASLAGAREAAQSWTPEPQPELAIEVKPPAGGWDTPVAPLSMRQRPVSKTPATKRLAQ